MQSSDQAAMLRQRQGAMRSSTLSSLPPLPAIAITGGKGGVGKTSLSVNLAIALAQSGLKPLLVDLDMGLANADVLLGINPVATLFDVVYGELPLEQAIVHQLGGVSFVPAASGREEMTRLDHKQFAKLVRQVYLASEHHDILLLDTMAGISREVTTFLRISRMLLFVMTPDPTSMTDAYALIKVLEKQEPGRDIRIIVNQCSHDEEGMLTFQRLQKVVQAYLSRDVSYYGCIPRDNAMVQAVRRRKPVVSDGNSLAAMAIKGIATRLRGDGWARKR